FWHCPHSRLFMQWFMHCVGLHEPPAAVLVPLFVPVDECEPVEPLGPELVVCEPVLPANAPVVCALDEWWFDAPEPPLPPPEPPPTPPAAVSVVPAQPATINAKTASQAVRFMPTQPPELGRGR